MTSAPAGSVAIDSIYDMRTLFGGIPLDQMSVSMTMNGAVIPILALYVHRRQGQGHRRARRAVGRDHPERHPREFMVTNTTTSIRRRRAATDRLGHLAYTSAEDARFNSISISGYHMRRPGRRRISKLATPSPTVSRDHPGRRGGRSRCRQVRAAAGFFWAIGMNFFAGSPKLRERRGCS
ncbi:MAG: methylmalonyl-CoA mutase family protein [Dermatophilaceae bacterium]